ncbi:penicillin-binding protein 2 [Actinotalea sp. BY-33]|uniref:Penicillin-binding protein 2 n=1 Tax=Actinotalea soli TaxID=2819234 RepID=A0A939LSG6_9CELL|nr:penicillin-binding protein 2 [Actinotalea soli]
MLLAIVVVALLALVVRLVQVQVIEASTVAAEAFDQRLTTVAIPAERGDIVDSRGEVLATSVVRYDIFVDQVHLSENLDPADLSEAAGALARLLDLDAAELAPVLWGPEDPDDKRRYVYLTKGVAPDVYEKVLEQEVPGVAGDQASERYYPAGTTAGNVLGFVGAEGYGQAGLEQIYDELLTGEPGSQTYERGARGQRIPTGEQGVEPAVPGEDLQLTLMRDLQYVAQDAIDEQVAASGAEWGVVQIIDVSSGEILVLADSNAVDPNDPGATPTADRGSRSSWTVYEPGSTAKVVTMAAALDAGLATPTSQYVIPDQYTAPNGQQFKDSHEHEDLKLTLTGVLAESSNTGTVMVGQNLPTQVRHDYLSKFGFGRLTGVGLPGESAGILHDADSWDGRTQYAVLFGQGLGATTLQSTQVFATLANGGVRKQPHLVKGTVDEDGTEHPAELAEPERVVSEETAGTIVRMLESAVADGTGANAAIPGYRVAGKTGTAQAFEGNGVIKHVASFIGIAPADDPVLAVNVALYDPKTSIYGGAVAAPVFSEVTGYALRYLGVPPSTGAADLYPTTYE